MCAPRYFEVTMPSKRGPYKQYEFKGTETSIPKSSSHAAVRSPPPKKKRPNAAAVPSRGCPPRLTPGVDGPIQTLSHIPAVETSDLPHGSEEHPDGGQPQDMWQFTDSDVPIENESSEENNNLSDEHDDLSDEHDDLSDDNDEEESCHSAQYANPPPEANNPAPDVDPDDSDDEELFAAASDLNLSVPERIKVLLLLATKYRHKLTYPAAEAIMRLTGVLSKDVSFAPSKHILKTAISLYSSSLSEHHLCPCGFYMGAFEEVKQCNNCQREIDAKSNKKEGNVFLYLSVADQIESLLKSGLHDELIHPQHRQKIVSGNYEDIFDGKLYKKLVPLNSLSFNFFVDGLQIGTTTKQSAWPVLLSLNELPLKLRREHVLMASVWLGKGKPKIMNEYLKPFVEECIQLQRDGITVKLNGQDKTFQVVPLMCVSDSVARPVLRCSKQFNGLFGCGLCYHPGFSIRRGRGKCRSYSIADREFPRRTHEETLDLARRAIATKKVQRGIKGLSILAEIPGFDIVNCLDLDLFHALVNCAKRFTNLWLKKKYSSKQFNVHERLAEIDRRLLSITPTDAVSRAPRSLTERSDWRGHEWFNWVVFYSIPTLAGILPKRFLNHWNLLVRGIVILMQNSVSKSEAVYAGRYLRQFNAEIDALYGSEHVTFSTHLLTHLHESVINFGQPWTHSAFLYENFNGEIKCAVHSSNGACHQICKHMQLKIALKCMEIDLEFAMSDSEKDFLQSVMRSANPLVDAYLTIDGVGFLGEPKTVTLAPNLHRAIQRNGIQTVLGCEYQMFDRCIVNSEVYQSVMYSRAEKKNNSVVLLTAGSFFEIHSFIVIDRVGLALGHYLVRNPRRLCTNDIPHIQIFNENVEDTLRCVPISKFETKVLSFSLPIADSEPFRFACINVLQKEMLR